MKTIVKETSGLDAVRLENDRVSALVLPGKGCDLLEFVWKPGRVNCFYKSDTPDDSFRGLDLKANRLRSHSDRSLGGWMDALPHRGRYKDMELTQETGGIAATLPWEYKISGDELNCQVLLPEFPLLVEKTFTLLENRLLIREHVTNRGDEPMAFTWTQHALFGGDLVDDATRVTVPAACAFDAWAHMADPDRGVEPHCYPIKEARLKHGVADLTRPLPPDYPSNEFVVFRGLAEGWAALTNTASHLSITIRWDLGRFPYLRALFQTEGKYIIGLEPGDDSFSDFEYSQRYGTFTAMEPGEIIDTCFSLEYSAEM